MDRWIEWECPDCHKTLQDPDTVSETCCHCGCAVMLDPKVENGRKEAWKIGNVAPIRL